jgi:mannosyltransferase
MTGTAARPATGTLVLACLAIGVALLLPVGATADWLDPAYDPTPSDVTTGVWLFKASLAAVALTALALQRVPSPAGPTVRLPLDRPTTTILAAIVVVALVLRLYQAGTELWLDEILLRTRYVPLDFRQLVSTFDSQNHQPFYSLLARVSFLTLGGTDWSVRIPAILLGVGSIVAVWALARQLTSSAESLLAALLLAVSYHHVWFSQNARGYTTMMLLAVIASGIFIRLCEGRGDARRLAWAYAAAMALATYTHLTAAFIAVGHALAFTMVAALSSGYRRRALWPLISLALSGLLTVTLYALMLPQVVRQMTQPTMDGVEVAWTGVGWMVREAVRVLSTGIPGGILTVLLAFSVLGIGVVSYWRRSRLATLVMFVPVLVTLTAILASGHNLWPRFFFFAAGFFVLAALHGGFVLVHAIVRWHPVRVAVAGASAIALVSLATVPAAWQPKQQFRAAFEFVERERQPGDAVVALDAAASVYDLRGWAPGWRLTRLPVDLEELERSAPRTWIVFTLGVRLRAIAPETYERLSTSRYKVVRVFPATVGGGEIHVLRHDSTNGND